ncbi:MAG: hypothetical protein M5U23_03120 [Acidimicrobiia bacterium]|nr:hypothetical protein [Acidimicrobiia bacterium]
MVSSNGVDDDGSSVSDVELARLRGENETLRSRLALRMRWRRWVSVILVILTTLSVVATTVAVWAHETIFDTDRFMETVQPALDDPALYAAMSERVSDEIIVALALETRIAATLAGVDEYLSETLIEAFGISGQGQVVLEHVDRPSLAVLAAPISAGLETRIAEIVDEFITSDEFQARFINIVEQAHMGAVALVRNNLAELPNVYIDNGEVRLNLMPTITEALRRVIDEFRDFLPDVTLPDVISDSVDEGRQQLVEAVNAQLPEDFGQITLLSEQRLEGAQNTANRLDRFVWALVLLSIILVATTIAISPTRRRTVIQLTLGIAAGLVIGVAATRRLESAIVEDISNPNGRAAAKSLLVEVVASLRTVAVIVIAIALIVAIVAYFVGRPAWVTDLSDRLKSGSASEPVGSSIDHWIAPRHDALRIAGFAVSVIVLFITGIGLVSVIVVTGGLALYLWRISLATRRA